MRMRILTLAAIIALCAAGASAGLREAEHDTTAVEKMKLHPQTQCPVMGGKIDSTIYADMQGQRIYFCCPGCVKTFKKNPEKYFAEAAKEGILFENVQTKCPVLGNPIDKNAFLYYKGRGIYFCCRKCVSTFLTDPEKYLKRLDETDTESEGKSRVEKEEHGHKQQ